MQLANFPYRRLIGAAALAGAAALIPAAALAATTSSAAPAGAAVPAGFRPYSASFYSPAAGVVLGGVGCQHRRRRALALPQRARRPGSRGLVHHRRDGWLYDPIGGRATGGARGPWATHDRGRHWRKLWLGGQVIDSMAASAGTVA